MKEYPTGARVALFEDGPFKSLLEDIGIPVEVLPRTVLKEVRRESGLLSLFAAVPAVRKLRRQLAVTSAGADLLYANSQKAFLLSALAKRSGQPLLWHLRDILTGEHFSSLLKRIAVFAGNHFASVVVVNSQATADAFVKAGGKQQKIRVVPDGVNPHLFDRLDETVIAQLREKICPTDVFLVAIFGRLSEWKGQHILLDAVALLPEVHVCLVGDALFGEDAYAEALRSRAAMPDLAGRVHFLGFRKDVAELMKVMDVIVHASILAEPLGRVIIEGMLARKPVIATRAGGAVEILRDRETGLLVEPGSVQEMKQAIELLRTDPNLAAGFAAAGRLRAESAFSLKLMVQRMQAVFAELEQKKAPSRASKSS